MIGGARQFGATVPVCVLRWGWLMRKLAKAFGVVGLRIFCAWLSGERVVIFRAGSATMSPHRRMLWFHPSIVRRTIKSMKRL
jgi:hypothetical protein